MLQWTLECVWFFSILVFSEYMPSIGIAGSYDHFIPSFLRNPHTVLHSDCINLYSYRQCKSVPFFPHPLLHLLFVNFLMMTILTHVRWYFIVFLMCISLLVMFSIFSHVHWPFVCLLWRTVCLGLLPNFWWGCLFSWYWAVRAAYISWRVVLCQLFHL